MTVFFSKEIEFPTGDREDVDFYASFDNHEHRLDEIGLVDPGVYAPKDLTYLLNLIETDRKELDKLAWDMYNFSVEWWKI